MGKLDLSKITKGQLTGLLRDLETFVTTPKKIDATDKGIKRKAFHTIAAKAAEAGVTTLNDIGLTPKQVALVRQDKPAKSTHEQRQVLAAITVGAARKCGLKVPPVVEKHFNV